MSTPNDNQRLRVSIIKALDSHEDDLNSNPTRKEFAQTSKHETAKEIMICNDALDHMQNQDD